MVSKWLRRFAVFAAVGFGIVSGPATAVAAVEVPPADAEARPVVQAASTDDFVFDSLDVHYLLTRADDGTSLLRVEERFVAVFPETDQNRGMRRIIDDSYAGQPLFPELISITDADGAPRESEVDADDGTYAMTSRSDDYVHGAQTYVFTYELRNVTRAFADTRADEFYWNVNGAHWAQPFGQVTVTLQLDPELAAARTGAQACYAGDAGSTATCYIIAEGGTITALAGPLAPHQTMTIAVGFDAGTFAEFDDSYLASDGAWLQLPGVLVVAVGVVAAAVVRARRLRDAPGRPSVIAEYAPPGVDALTSAVFLGRTTKAVPAEVLEQAVRGSIRIVEGDRSFFGSMRLQAVLVDRSLADGNGAQLLDGLFGEDAQPGEVFTFGGSNTALAATAERVTSEASALLVAQGLYRKVSGWTRAWPLLIVLMGAAIAVIGGVIALDEGAAALLPLLLIVVPILAFVAACILVGHRPLTAAGAELRDHLEGLRQFIEWAEADRIRMLQSPRAAERIDTADRGAMLRIYEPLLPYAVVFGQEKQWAAHLSVLYSDDITPSWYVGTGSFNVAAFSAGISSLSATTASSTSGGSTGGGSAGGGGGGGGGGGV